MKLTWFSRSEIKENYIVKRETTLNGDNLGVLYKYYVELSSTTDAEELSQKSHEGLLAYVRNTYDPLAENPEVITYNPIS